MYGAQAKIVGKTCIEVFENDVEMYGAQAQQRQRLKHLKFENDVEMYGAQAFWQSSS